MSSGHREVETKYDVDEATALPELADLPDVAAVDGPHTFRLEATYFDTDDLALGRHGITLRRRTGGHDDGWHLKLPVEDARQEIHAALGRSARTPPIALRRIVHGVVREKSIGPVATVQTERTMASLLDADEDLLAEVCDDRVVATRLGPAGEEEHAWREWELEQHTSPRRLVKAVDTRMRKAGARVAAHQSKFARVMHVDLDAPPHDGLTTRKRASERELLGRQLAGLRAELHRLDPLARADVPDAVHQMRVACRRLRATLATFDKFLDVSRTEPLQGELKWLGDVLGRPRDLEVLRTRLGTLLLTQPPALVRGRPGPWIDSQLRSAHRVAHREALDAMASDRYFALVDALDSWRTEPPWADRQDRPAAKRLPKALEREWKRVTAAAADADAASDSERAPRLHDVRKAAKRARYAAETLTPVLGSEARALARSAKQVQSVLGDYHDAFVAAEQVRALAEAAESAGRSTFTLGVLHARLETQMTALEGDFERTWKKVQKWL